MSPRIPSAMAVPLLALALPAPAANPSACERAGTPARTLVTESRHLSADTPGIELYLRNKHPAELQTFPAGGVDHAASPREADLPDRLVLGDHHHGYLRRGKSG